MDPEEEVSLTYADVAPLVVKTFKSFVWSLGVVAIFFATVNICFAYLRQIAVDPQQVVLSISMVNQIKHYPVAIGALKYNSRLNGQVDLYLLNSSGCSITDFDAFKIEKSKSSIVFITDGYCLLKSKIENAHHKGFSAVLLANHGQPSKWYKQGRLDELDISILTANPFNSRRLFMLMSDKSVCSAALESNLVNPFSIKTFLVEILINLVVIYIAELLVMTLWLVMYIITNIILYRNFRIYQSIVNGCLALSEESTYVPKLQTIPFPEKTLTQKNVEDLKTFKGVFESDISAYHDSCCICLEEFQINSRVRSLPCRHLFHTSCIDPWLLGHNRLCPVCQQDVLKTVRLRDHRNIFAQRRSDSDLESLFDSSRIHGNSIRNIVARWIQSLLG